MQNHVSFAPVEIPDEHIFMAASMMAEHTLNCSFCQQQVLTANPHEAVVRYYGDEPDKELRQASMTIAFINRFPGSPEYPDFLEVFIAQYLWERKEWMRKGLSACG